MGQWCSSTNKHPSQSSLNAPSPRASEDAPHEELHFASGPDRAPSRRRALDERTAGTGWNGAPPADEASKKPLDPGLAAVRGSVDDATCAALLALRNGRGSSVGGLPRPPASSAAGSHAGRGGSLDLLASLPEAADAELGDASDAGGGGGPGGGGEEGGRAGARSGGRGGGRLGSAADGRCSGEQLEVLLRAGGSNAPPGAAPVLPHASGTASSTASGQVSGPASGPVSGPASSLASGPVSGPVSGPASGLASGGDLAGAAEGARGGVSAQPPQAAADLPGAPTKTDSSSSSSRQVHVGGPELASKQA